MNLVVARLSHYLLKFWRQLEGSVSTQCSGMGDDYFTQSLSVCLPDRSNDRRIANTLCTIKIDKGLMTGAIEGVCISRYYMGFDKIEDWRLCSTNKVKSILRSQHLSATR